FVNRFFLFYFFFIHQLALSDSFISIPTSLSIVNRILLFFYIFFKIFYDYSWKPDMSCKFITLGHILHFKLSLIKLYTFDTQKRLLAK
ncbi:hypothetical protein MXZ81_10210, partial [Streptococcus uberis]|nr:hypothetical protein [Streptococcus uberis]